MMSGCSLLSSEHSSTVSQNFCSLLHHLENCSFWLLSQACMYILSVYFVSSTVTLALWYTEVLPTQFLTHLSCSFSALIPGE